ncbi:flagellar hook-associated protein 3 FlgL [Anaerotaenia torta]|uniref:flagellar hook-associated protein FlgL n=1 Tax=Anaerotaenia torta TaxID=433293 RepID=UPI003D1CED86
MRITNKMMTNNMMTNINKNKINLDSLEQQYSTGKKIQRPSEDPIIAVRALRLRTNLSELKQYYKKNIPDAKSWMEVTESAMTTVNGILKSMNTYCVQGSTDTLTASDRSAIVKNLEEMQQQINQEGNTNYAGRYVFTGYKTDSPLIFTEDASNLSYDITERFTGKQIQILNRCTGGKTLEAYENGSINLDEAPQLDEIYRIQLAYDRLDADEVPDEIAYSVKDANGVDVPQTAISNIEPRSLTDADAYQPDPDEVHYIHETGELIFGSNVYALMRQASDMSVTYTKNSFASGELKPEHYFTCTMTDSSKPEQGPVTYTQEAQKIQYEVNFNQKLTINTEGRDAFSHQIGRSINDILNAVNEVVEVENTIAEVEKRLTDVSLSDADKEGYTKLKEQLETELVLKKEIMQDAFSRGITVTSKEQDRINTAVADLGSRYVRLELTEERLSDQEVDFTDLLSTNEDADMAETIIKYGTAGVIYNASLSAASKVVQSTLLDFL